MQNLIQLLPDAIANQIAAGEVVQRPASVVKELLENAVDAGASRIELLIKNAGKTLIQVSDNGCGMSAQDARMCFERHATSKIRTQDDLFNIRTLGFRGEALASVAAVAQVRLRTRQHDEELGTEIQIEASEIKSQSPCTTPPGTVFSVKNLFFNVPARRNFLKSNPVEARHVINEFIHVALGNPQVYMSLKHNDTPVYDLPESTLEQRIVELLGQELKGKLKYVEEATGYVKISGYIGDPTIYRKSRGEQFFFINNRFIRSNYLHHAVAMAYQEFIPGDSYPFYCIFLEIDPVHVDINIHPTKTEVKFDDERTLYVLLQSIVKRGLGETHQSPEFDFTDSDIKQSIYNSEPESGGGLTVGSFSRSRKPDVPGNMMNWDILYGKEENSKKAISGEKPEKTSRTLGLFESPSSTKPVLSEDAVVAQFMHSWILVQKEDQLYLIDQNLAHQRILYEKFLRADKETRLPCQQLLFPQTMEFSPMDFSAFQEAEPVLTRMGFEVKEFGRNTMIFYGMPAGIPPGKLKEIVDQVLNDIRHIGTTRVAERLLEGVAKSVAFRSAVTSSQKLSMLEMKNIASDLFRCDVPGFSPGGKPTFRVITSIELEEYFR
ncbi:MAG: DNA mismatch repair endonuclease MutL [Bacteroidia bacterium]|nr:DNA mismatch repair endonuclease MutL [Bacteroidia bacterium]